MDVLNVSRKAYQLCDIDDDFLSLMDDGGNMREDLKVPWVLGPTKDVPELGYVRDSSSKQYVPDVFFKEKDKYGNEVTKLARPLPVEYLLIDIAVATPLNPVQSFRNGFPVENRPMEGQLQDFASLASHRRQVPNLPDFFRDFHLLLYLGTQTVHPLDQELLQPLLAAIRDEKNEKIFAWAESSHWHTIEALIQNYNDGYQWKKKHFQKSAL